ncbi:MAG: IPExxxVDY family protein [Bacteroidetes bacterium]|nr:IPExxxVDY family protein [Bacteroidota bacterium]
MAKLVLDIEYEYDFVLIGISCHEKDYRLTWALNNSLNLELAKTNDLQIDAKKHKEPLTYSMSAFENEQQHRQYYLISNRCLIAALVPEQKQADFFLMIKGTLMDEDKATIIKRIKETPTVLTAFEIDPNKLKSKENLLF